MSGRTDPDHSEAGRFDIRVRGHLHGRWATWFNGLPLTHERDGTTVIHGSHLDQAALYGLLHKVRDTGLPLISVTPLAPVRPGPITQSR